MKQLIDKEELIKQVSELSDDDYVYIVTSIINQLPVFDLDAKVKDIDIMLNGINEAIDAVSVFGNNIATNDALLVLKATKEPIEHIKTILLSDKQ